MKLLALSPSLLARQSPRVRALLMKAAPVITTEVTRDGDALVIVMHNVKMPSLSNMSDWKAVNRAKQAQSNVLRPILAVLPVPPLPLDVEIVRIAPRMLDEGGNLYNSGKRLQDDLAKWCGVNDRVQTVVRYTVRQERGQTCVRIRIGPRIDRSA